MAAAGTGNDFSYYYHIYILHIIVSYLLVNQRLPHHFHQRHCLDSISDSHMSFQWRSPLLYSCASGHSHCSWLGLVYCSSSQCVAYWLQKLFMLGFGIQVFLKHWSFPLVITTTTSILLFLFVSENQTVFSCVSTLWPWEAVSLNMSTSKSSRRK